MNYKYYFFDFDYTLVNSEQGIVGCFIKTMEELGYPVKPWDEIKNTIGMPILDAIELLTGVCQQAKKEEFLRVYKTHAAYFMTPNTHFFPDTIATLKRLKAAGCKVAIISTKTRHRIAEKFQQDNCAELIDFIIGSEDTTASKPDPEGINMAIKKAGADKNNTVFIGDSVYDAGAAQNAGIDFIAVLTGTTPAEAFEAYPAKKIITALEQLT